MMDRYWKSSLPTTPKGMLRKKKRKNYSSSNLLTTNYVYDTYGRLTAETSPSDLKTGQPSSIVAPGNVTTTFTYDAYGRKTGISDQSAGTQTWTYDAAGNIASEKDAANKTISYAYDIYNRLTQKNTSRIYNCLCLQFRRANQLGIFRQRDFNGLYLRYLRTDKYGKRNRSRREIPAKSLYLFRRQCSIFSLHNTGRKCCHGKLYLYQQSLE